jgi:hypothetical protein
MKYMLLLIVYFDACHISSWYSDFMNSLYVIVKTPSESFCFFFFLISTSKLQSALINTLSVL